MSGLSFAWPWNPIALVVLLVLALIYLLGMRRVRKLYPSDTLLRPRQVISFYAGIFVTALLVLTPINTIARTQLFSVHMAQAVLLITLCSPLILSGCPDILLRPLVELPVVRSILRGLLHPVVASVIFNLTFLLWHAPLIYDSVVTNTMLYDVMILSIFLTSLLNWWPLMGTVHDLRGMSYPLQMLYAFFDGQPVDIYALVLIFGSVAIYTNYVVPPQLGLSAFGDQAIGGSLLLIPGLVDLVVMTPLFFRWLGQIEQRTKQDDARRQEEAELEDDEALEEGTELERPSESFPS
jgi:putative membrane protein